MPAQTDLPVRRCLFCQKSFYPYRANHIFCSDKCNRQFHRFRSNQNDADSNVKKYMINSYQANHDRITKINSIARSLGLSFGKYKAYIAMGLDPVAFKRSRFEAFYELS